MKKENIILREIAEELKESYLDYAMSVIASRALPDVRDGLKPVQRRILYTMHELGLSPQSKFIKSARVVGETLGKYHPHGDISVYDALVRMAQDFSLREVLIEGQGNFGSLDGDPPAAMRYTEVRLAPLAVELLKDIEKNTVEFIPNYDNTRQEPLVLPAKFPNLLVNGSVGIAVGMATNIPPHNLKEIAEALIYLIDNPEADLKEILKIVQGPDFPTGGVVFATELNQAYLKGKGKVVIRGVVDIQKVKERYQIVITEIPWQVNKAELVKQIANLVLEKKLPNIKDIRDESDKEGIRIVIELKTGASPQRVINYLYKHTDLQKNYHFNLLALDKGIQPRLFSLLEFLNAWLEHRTEVVRKRTEYELRKVNERLHLLEGFLIALKAIDKIINLIKKSKDKEEAKKKLIKNFNLTEIQAEAILEMPLRSLAGLERTKIENEYKEKTKLKRELEHILKSPKGIDEVIKKELKEIIEKYSSPRKTEIIKKEAPFLKEEIIKEPTLIVVTQKGFLRRIKPEIFHPQKRGGKGTTLKIREEDSLVELIFAQTDYQLYVFSEDGRVFKFPVIEIPEGTRESLGKNINYFIDFGNQVAKSWIAIEKELKGYFLVITNLGLAKKIPLSEFRIIRKSGTRLITLRKGEKVVKVIWLPEETEVLVITKKGIGLRIKSSDLRASKKTAGGVKLIKLKPGDEVVDLTIAPKDSEIILITENGLGKRMKINEVKIQKRGGQGMKIYRISEKGGNLVGGKLIQPQNEELIISSLQGQTIKIPLNQVKILKRTSQGIKLMKVAENNKVLSFALI